MIIQKGTLLVPYAVKLQDIETNRNANFEGFMHGCQILADTGQEELKSKVLLIAICWNFSIKFKGFYLPVVLRVYTQDHYMQFTDKENDFEPVAEAISKSFAEAKKLWQSEMKGTAIVNMVKEIDTVALEMTASDILDKAEHFGYYD